MSSKMIKRCQAFREALKSECVAIPGAFNGLVAKSVAENGINCLFDEYSLIESQVSRLVMFLVLLFLPLLVNQILGKVREYHNN